MIKTKVINNASGTTSLCETYSTEGYKLLQVETNRIYDSSVLDVIIGYDENNCPYSKYTYIETEEKDPYIEERPEETQTGVYEQIIDILTGEGGEE